MPIVAADWSADRATGDIRYIGDDHAGASPSYATVIEFHRWMQSLADDATSVGDDEIDITNLTPSDRSTDNIINLLGTYNIDPNAAEHLYDGSIIQEGGNRRFDGLVNFGNSTNIQIIQDGAVLADDWWNSDPQGNGFGLNSDPAGGISHRFLLETRTAGADIDGRRVLGLSRNFTKTYAEFSISQTQSGNNVLALSESDDLNNQTDDVTVAGWVTIVNNNEGYTGIDVTGDGVDEFYYSDWTLGTQSINDFYERAKWLQREGSAETLYGLPGELFRGITHEINIDGTTGTFQEPEAVSWATGTGQLLAIDDESAGTKMYIQLLTGTAPVNDDTITGGASSATADVNVTVTERTPALVFAGASTGTSIVGPYGLGIAATDLTASDRLFDLDNTQNVPPNNVVFTVNGLVAGEDRVLVGPESGGSLDESQFTIAVALSTDNVASVQIASAIPTDTPSSGTIRIADNDGRFRRLEYSSYVGDTFTISSTDGEEDFAAINANVGNNAYISYIDTLASNASESFTSVYLANRSLFIRVRDGAGTPIKTFETTGTLGSAGGSTTAIRTSDE